MNCDIRIKDIKCPRCRKHRVRILTEIFESSAEYSVEGNKRAENAVLNPGDIVRVQATCECGHRWKLHNTSQVTDIDDKGWEV